MPLAPQHIALILTPKPGASGLHALVEVRPNLRDTDKIELHHLNGTFYGGDASGQGSRLAIASAYFDSDAEQYYDARWIRSHSPGAGLDRGPYAGLGYGFALYAGLALHAAGQWNSGSRIAGIWSPDGNAHRSPAANAMWRNLVKLGIAKEAEAEDDDPEETTFDVEVCGQIADRQRDVEDRHGNSGWITDDEVCGEATAVTSGSSVMQIQILGPKHLLPNGYIVHWLDSSDYLSSAPAVAASWVVKEHVIVRADLGADATPDDFRMFAGFIEDRFPGAKGKKLAAQFLQREDVAVRLRARKRRTAAPRAPASAGLSGLSFGRAAQRGPPSQAFGALDVQNFPAAPLPPLTSSERADDRKWAVLDY